MAVVIGFRRFRSPTGRGEHFLDRVGFCGGSCFVGSYGRMAVIIGLRRFRSPTGFTRHIPVLSSLRKQRSSLRSTALRSYAAPSSSRAIRKGRSPLRSTALRFYAAPPSSRAIRKGRSPLRSTALRFTPATPSTSTTYAAPPIKSGHTQKTKPATLYAPPPPRTVNAPPKPPIPAPPAPPRTFPVLHLITLRLLCVISPPQNLSVLCNCACCLFY